MVQNRLLRFATPLVLAVMTGCAGNADMGKQLASNEQMRESVMGAITTNQDLAVVMQKQLLANDSLRTKVVDAMLQDSHSAEYVLYRIATNRDAVDMVLKAAVSDSSMRDHVFTLVKGMEMAQPARMAK